MEVNVIAGNVEPKEFDEINSILPIMWHDGLLTDIECRIITSSTKLVDKKGAIYTIIMSKTKEEAAILTEAFRKMTLAIHAEQSIDFRNTTDSNNEENHFSVLPSRNPFMNNTIIKYLFGFLSLEDMKEFRLVCRQWNATAEICLRKRSAIHFRHNVLSPQTFMEVSKYSHPDLPFPSFVFSNDENSSWLISEIQDFFEKWGMNIKEVTFNSLTLASKCHLSDQEVFISNYDTTQLFIKPSNITSLKINTSEDYEPKTTLKISLEKFVSLKTLSLNQCRIIVSCNNQSSHIAPLFVNVQWVSVIRNKEVATHFHYNDLFDCSKALSINLEQEFSEDDEGGRLDMSKNIFNVNELHLFCVNLKNWTQAKGNVQCLNLQDFPFVDKNNLKIKQLSATYCKIDLAVLPQTLEILQLAEDCSNDIICSESFHLPNLKYLWIHVEDYDSLSYFSNCPNLVELILSNHSSTSHSCRINLACIPKSVKRLTLERLQIEFTDNCIVELDTLILDSCNVDSYITDCIAITSKIKAKVLIVICNQKMKVDTSDIVKLVFANQQSEKILVGSTTNLHKTTPFEGSVLSKYVDQKSDLYKFENNFGKSISLEEFRRCVKMNDFSFYCMGNL